MEEINKVTISLEDYNKLKENEFELNRIKLQLDGIFAKCSYDEYDNELDFSMNRCRELAMNINPQTYINTLAKLQYDYNHRKEEE